MEGIPLLFGVLIEALIDHGFRVVETGHDVGRIDVERVRINLPTHSDDSFYELYINRYSPMIYVEAGDGRYSSVIDGYYLHPIHDGVNEMEILVRKMISNDPRDILAQSISAAIDKMRYGNFIQDAATRHMKDILRKIE